MGKGINGKRSKWCKSLLDIYLCSFGYVIYLNLFQ